MALEPIVRFFGFTDSGFTQGNIELGNTTNATVWAGSTNYSLGDVVYYNSIVYLCTTAHISTGIFEPEKWSVAQWTVKDILGTKSEVKAGESSASLFLRVWNNKGGSELCSTMQDCELMIFDGDNGQAQPIVTEGWLRGRCLSLGQNQEDDFVAVSITENPGVEETWDSTPILRVYKVNGLGIGSSSFPTDNKIGGDLNGGIDTDVSNFSNVELKFTVPNEAQHGTKGFSVAVKYFFV